MSDFVDEVFDCTIVTSPYPIQKYSVKWTIHGFSEIDRGVKSGFFCPFESMLCIMELDKLEGEKGVRITVRATCSKLHYAVDGNVSLNVSEHDFPCEWSFSDLPVAAEVYTALVDKRIRTDNPFTEEFSIVLRLSARRIGEETKISYKP